MTWAAWVRSGRESVAHATEAREADVAVGSFPLLCGKWAPDAFDVEAIHVVQPANVQRCLQCVIKAATS